MDDYHHVLVTAKPEEVEITVVHSFVPTGRDGASPEASGLVSDGTSWFGVAAWGGYNAAGVVFRMNLDGSDYTLLHSFGQTPADGLHPSGTLAYVDGVLFGTTEAGGTSDLGTVYRMDLDGTGHVVLHSFTGEPEDGALPVSEVIRNRIHPVRHHPQWGRRQHRHRLSGRG